MIEISAVKLANYLDDLKFKKILSLVSLEKQIRAKKFLRIEDAYRTVIGELLIRKIICEKFKIDNKLIKFEKNKYGKPFLKGYSNFHFNISHSKEWIVCAVSDNLVGIDIEEIKPIDLKIVKTIFTKEEYADLISKGKNRLNYFYDLWTLKESYIKAVGKGLSLSLDSFSIRKLDDENIKLKANDKSNKYFFRMYDIDSNYKLAVCSFNNSFPDKVIIKSQEILNLGD